MGHMIENISSFAEGWNKHLVWIGANVGYIKAELPNLQSKGFRVQEIQELVEQYLGARAALSRVELEAFSAAHAYEVGEGSVDEVKQPLEALRMVLRPWLGQFHALNEALNEEAEPGLPAMLLNCCGAEIFAAHTEFSSIVKTFIDLLEVTGRFEPPRLETIN